MPFDDPPLPLPFAGDGIAPNPSLNLTATPGDGQVLLGWNDAPESDFNHYRVYMSTVSGGPYDFITTTGISESVISGLVNGTTYYFVVTVMDDFGFESDQTAEVSATPEAPPGGDVTPPAVPTGLFATAGDQQIVLDWSDVGDSDFNHYRVYRATVTGGPYTQIATRTVSNYTDTGLTNGTQYFYVVSAVDLTGNESAQSSEDDATPSGGAADTTPPGAPSGLIANAGDEQISLNWNDNTEPDLASYKVYRTLVGGSFVHIATRLTSDFINESLTNGTQYFYRVSALDTSNNESALSPVVSATPAAPPGGGVAFMTRPASGLISISNQDNFTITNVSINGGTVSSPSGIGITLINCKQVRITFVDFQNLIGGIYLSQCENVVIEDCRGRNIGDGTIGSGHSNFIQFADSRGGAIRRCKFLGGRTEDMISTWHSGGWSLGQELIIEDNQLQGLIATTAEARHWTSASGTGIIISDGAGYIKNGFVIVRRNRLLNPGQVGLQHIDGPGLQTYDNIIYAEPYSLNNNPITTWEGVPQGVCRDNRYRFIKGDLTEPTPFEHEGSQMTFTNNVRDTSLTAASLQVTL